MLAVRVSAFLASSAEEAVSRSADWGGSFSAEEYAVAVREYILYHSLREWSPPSAEEGKGMYTARRLKSRGDEDQLAGVSSVMR